MTVRDFLSEVVRLGVDLDGEITVNLSPRAVDNVYKIVTEPSAEGSYTLHILHNSEFCINHIAKLDAEDKEMGIQLELSALWIY
jgi:hypothetical protein